MVLCTARRFTLFECPPSPLSSRSQFSRATHPLRVSLFVPLFVALLAILSGSVSRVTYATLTVTVKEAFVGANVVRTSRLLGYVLLDQQVMGPLAWTCLSVQYVWSPSPRLAEGKISAAKCSVQSPPAPGCSGACQASIAVRLHTDHINHSGKNCETNSRRPWEA